MRYVVNVKIPPIPPPSRTFKNGLFSNKETDESIIRRKEWEDYMKKYRSELELKHIKKEKNMIIKKVKYGLNLKKYDIVLGYITTSNEGCDFCGDTTTTLTDDKDDLMWLVDDPINAEFVRNFSTEWYNAGYDTPKHSYEKDELEVIKIETIINMDPVDVEIPSVKEFYRLVYEKSEPEHYKYIIKQKDIEYSLYDLKKLIEDKKWTPNK